MDLRVSDPVRACERCGARCRPARETAVAICATCNVRQCPVCAAPARWPRVYCSALCRNRSRSGFRPAERSCEQCSLPFESTRPAQRYCDAACRKRAADQRWGKSRVENPAAKQARWIKRKRLIATTQCEPIDKRSVFDRDGWRCGPCGGAVNPALEWPRPMSASLDHVVPLSAGGGHVLANVQCAHLGCNLRKGAKVA